MSRNRMTSRPRQRLPYSRKTREWRKKNVDYGNTLSLHFSPNVRKSLKNKIINTNLYNGILDMEDLNNIVNPYHLDASFIPQTITHNPILAPKIDLLVGEETKRSFEYRAVVTNQKALSQKDDARKAELMERLINIVMSDKSEEEAEAEFEQLGKYMNYDWQDIRERMVNQILKHYSQEQRFPFIFTECFKSALLHGECAVQIEIVHGEPVMTPVNTLKLRTVNTSNSSRIEDSDIIILEDHWSPGKIIDYFHDELKPKDIEAIENYNSSGSSDTDNHYTNERKILGSSLDSLFEIAEVNGHYFNSDLTDEDGNIRVLRVYWKSIKKVKKVKYYDEFGDIEYKIRSEDYVENKTMGEESETLWINEMWEGTLIGQDIYINMRPRKEQYTRLSNPSYCHAGIIGQVYNTDQGKAVSLVDRMKNYQYLYDVMWDRLNKAISTNYGKIFEVDFAKIPAGWDMEKWLHFAIVNKIAVVDSFKEGNKGASLGKLAGGMNTQGGRSIDMETGNYIQQHINMLEFIKQEMGEIAGITKQREGQISNRETVGGVERSVNQSANVTEFWFTIHEHFKLRALEAFVEAAKIALRDNKKKMQYVLDDLSISSLEVDGEIISDADFGIVVSNSNKNLELEQVLKSLSQTLVQSTGRISPVIDIFTSDSISDMRRKIENTENELEEQARQQAEEANQTQQQIAAMEEESKELDRETELAIAEMQEETKRYIAELRALSDQDDGVIDPSEDRKLDIEEKKVENDLLTKMKELRDRMEMHKDSMKREDRKIANDKKKTSNK